MSDDLLSRLPHGEPMRLITRCVSTNARQAVCEAMLADNPLFAGAQKIPVLFSTELVAQAGAVLLAAIDEGTPRPGGRLVSIRTFDFYEAMMTISRPLTINVELLNDASDTLLLFKGSVSTSDGVQMAQGQVAIFRNDE